MSVYTIVKATNIEKFLSKYKMDLLCASPIKKGTVNSNYLLKTSLGDFILTIFEKMKPDEIGNIFSLTNQLHNVGVKCPPPIPNEAGNYIGTIAEKPAAIISMIHGDEPLPITTDHVSYIGSWLGNMHYSSDLIRLHDIENPMGRDWRDNTWNELKKISSKKDLLEFEKHFSQVNPTFFDGASRGFCHCDLFPDNTLFSNSKLNGVIDFYYACTEAFIYDLAICVNAWCFSVDGKFYYDRYKALIASYLSVNKLNDIDNKLWPAALKLATLRFWLSRLYSKYYTERTENISIKDPNEIQRIMNFHQEKSLPLFLNEEKTA